MFTLAIETSCDETSAAVLEDKKILSNIISSQLFHTNFGGVVPELASREHTRNITYITDKALKDSGVSLKDIDIICATNTPGLIGALLVGLNFARAMALSLNKPFVPVNHIMSHLYSNMVEMRSQSGDWERKEKRMDYSNSSQVEDSPGRNPSIPRSGEKKVMDSSNASIEDPSIPRSDHPHSQSGDWEGEEKNNTQPEQFPFLGLIVSGGHTLLILVEGLFKHKILGSTVDDAAGEAFDKGAKMLGLGYPGGPIIDKMAKSGNIDFHKFPLPMLGEKGYDFSFSGSKTSLLYFLKEINFKPESDELTNNICASYQDSITEILYKKTLKAAKEYKVKSIALSGGVSANSDLRRKFTSLREKGYKVYFPSLELSSDNAAMIGLNGYLQYINSNDKEFFLNSSLLTNAVPRLDYDNF